MSSTAPVRVDVTMQLALDAAVIVTARDSFKNLADLTNPAENLVGVASAASEGAVTGRQIETRPIMRAGEVLEVRARGDHQPAQRRGKGKPVLPARIQSRSRHRLCDHRRRPAGQLAHPRARTGLLRSELPHPRARERCAVQEGSRTRRRRATSLLPGPQTSTTSTCWPAPVRVSASARMDGLACSPPCRRGWVPAISSAHWN